MRRPVHAISFGPEPGRRLRELRKRAGLSQAELALKMGRCTPSYRALLSRLEAGHVPHPTLSLLSDYLKACGSGFADIADLLGIDVPVSADEAQPKERVRKPAKPKSYPEQLAAVQRRAHHLLIRGTLETTLYVAMKDSALPQDPAVWRKVAAYGRLAFKGLVRRQRELGPERKKLTEDPKVRPEYLDFIEKVAQTALEFLVEKGELDRQPDVDAEEVLAGRAKLIRSKPADAMLMAELRAEFEHWGSMRRGVLALIWRECMDLLMGTGMTEQQAGTWGYTITTLCSIAEQSPAESEARARLVAEQVKKAQNPDAMRLLADHCLRRWDELKHTIPPKP